MDRSATPKTPGIPAPGTQEQLWELCLTRAQTPTVTGFFQKPAFPEGDKILSPRDISQR